MGHVRVLCAFETLGAQSSTQIGYRAMIVLQRRIFTTDNLQDFLDAKRKEMQENNIFDEEYTLRNPHFGPEHRQKLIDTCNLFGTVYIK